LISQGVTSSISSTWLTPALWPEQKPLDSPPNEPQGSMRFQVRVHKPGGGEWKFQLFEEQTSISRLRSVTIIKALWYILWRNKIRKLKSLPQYTIFPCRCLYLGTRSPLVDSETIDGPSKHSKYASKINPIFYSLLPIMLTL
jgi:hypothetical protein